MTLANINTRKPALSINGAGPVFGLDGAHRFIDIHRRAKFVAGGPWRKSQMESLRQTGKWIIMADVIQANGGSAAEFRTLMAPLDAPSLPIRTFLLKEESEEELAAANERARDANMEREPALAELNDYYETWSSSRPQPGDDRLTWIHYLAYSRAQPGTKKPDGTVEPPGHSVLCTTLTDLEDCMGREAEEGPARKHVVDLATVNCYRFIDVLLNAFEPISQDGMLGCHGWLRVTAETVRQMLPALQTLGDVFMTTDKGGEGFTITCAADSGASCDANPAGNRPADELAQVAVPQNEETAALDTKIQPTVPTRRHTPG
ncbi:hypothetical protein [Luteibacter aegosomatissinici]|uniref:hypothetical protein n=1 Tax=Luteibacter aegosomatissinici TaxID=2911539 RepID=UPI001FF7F734|nr:hypothetical protein [Luteibacter aegosomatissinici]UPG92797.1 hypothetical protein L2Y97_13075 [Luteibacter aegosomatissinici]